MKKILFIVLGAIVVIAALIFIFGSKNGDTQDYKLVTVQKGAIVEKALAVGTIEPAKEIKVKSAISGIVSNVFFEIGDIVEKGSPLFKVSPNPTPLEYAEARRGMEIAEITMKQIAKEQARLNSLYTDQIIPHSEMEAMESRYKESSLRYKIAMERFKLLEDGNVKVSEKKIDSIIRSPITGVVLSQDVYVGDPVVPLTNYQPGTELCAMADMGSMMFKGTVDEIDVGKLEPGMPVEINIGARPDTKMSGNLKRISPKAKKEGNATLFDIEAFVSNITGKMLRAGYSATAYVRIREKKDVLVLPERLVKFEDGKRFVEVKEGGSIKKIEIKTGLSDSINIEVTEGLKKGRQVVERPPAEIK